MKRFYSQATVIAEDGGWAIRLDDRPVRTPSRAPLLLPSVALGDAVAAEWNAQGETLDPRTMPFTGFSNAAIDQIAPDKDSFAAGLARYGESDLLCYRADGPTELILRQEMAWDPLLDWARSRYDITLHQTAGIIHVAQPAETLERLGGAVSALDVYTLAGFSALVTLSGSLLCALAVIEQFATPEQVWETAELDEIWQIEQWGDDTEAAARRASRAAEFLVAAAFCRLSYSASRA